MAQDDKTTQLLLDVQKHDLLLDSLEKRVAAMEVMQLNIQDLTYTVKSLAESIKKLTEDQDNLGNRLNALESIPADNWKTVMKTFLTVTASALGGAIVAAIIGLL